MSGQSVPLSELAEMVGGTVRGDSSAEINNAWPLGDACAGSITLVDQVERLSKLEGTDASAVLLPEGAPETELPSITVSDVHAAFIQIVMRFRPPREDHAPGVHPTAVIDPTALLGEGLSVGPGVVIGSFCQIGDGVTIGPKCVVMNDCVIGDQTELTSRVTLYRGTVVGSRCKLHAGVVLGADGFGYKQEGGEHQLVAQLGNVEVGDDVDIGANTTKVGDGTKIDNLVQIGHNCHIGRRNLICSQVGIAGSTSTGDHVVMAGQVGVRDHVHIGKGAILSAMAGVSNDVPEGQIMLGAPATPLRDAKLQMAAVAKLPQLRKDFRQLKRELAELREQLENKSKPESHATDSERAA